MELNRLNFATYGRVRVTGHLIPSFETGQQLERFLSPDGIRAVHLQSQGNGTISITNKGNIGYTISVKTSMNGASRVLANITYDPINRNVRVNDNWTIEPLAVENTMIQEHDLLVESRFLCFDLYPSNYRMAGENRIDIQVGVGHFATLIFSRRDLLGIQFNGNDYFEILGPEVERLYAIVHGNPQAEELVIFNVAEGVNNEPQAVLHEIIEADEPAMPHIVENIANADGENEPDIKIIDAPNPAVEELHADINVGNDDGEPPMPLVVDNNAHANGENEPVIEIIDAPNPAVEELRADINVGNDDGEPPMPLVVDNNAHADGENEPVIEIIDAPNPAVKELRADINVGNDDGEPPMPLVVENNANSDGENEPAIPNGDDEVMLPIITNEIPIMLTSETV